MTKEWEKPMTLYHDNCLTSKDSVKMKITGLGIWKCTKCPTTITVKS